MRDTKQVLSDLTKGMKAEPVRNSRFTGSVVAVSDDHSRIRVRLCTGSFLDVPTSVLKNLRHLGTTGQNGEQLGLVVGDLDTSTDAGVLIHQMGLEITRLSQLMRGSSTVQGAETGSVTVRGDAVDPNRVKPDFGTVVLPPETIKMSFNGIAGSPVTLRYHAPPNEFIGFNQGDWTVSNFQNCFLTQPPVLGPWTPMPPSEPLMNAWIEFNCDAAHGTPVGQFYNAYFFLTVVLVELTT